MMNHLDLKLVPRRYLSAITCPPRLSNIFNVCVQWSSHRLVSLPQRMAEEQLGWHGCQWRMSCSTKLPSETSMSPPVGQTFTMSQAPSWTFKAFSRAPPTWYRCPHLTISWFRANRPNTPTPPTVSRKDKQISLTWGLESRSAILPFSSAEFDPWQTAIKASDVPTNYQNVTMMLNYNKK